MRYATRFAPRREQVQTYDVTGGVAAACPTCGQVNVAVYGADGRLVWWPNTEIGKWCQHNEGAYAGASVLAPVMQFKVFAPISEKR